MKKVVVGITGASGSIYGKRLIEELLKRGIEISVIATLTGEEVFAYELGMSLRSWIQGLQEKNTHVKLEDIKNLFAGVASGSHSFDGMVIVPCSMGTLAEISNGLSKNLLTRAADVALKEKRKLLLVPRETPLNSIHLQNMLTLSQAGASILPAMPAFYHKPHSIEALTDFVVGKVLDQLSINNNLFKKWENLE